MALQVWLPLNGNLNNQGLADVTVTTTDTQWQTDGKIGSCLKLGVINKFTIPSMVGSKQMSFSYWVRVNTATSTNWLDSITWYSTDGNSSYTSRQEFYNNSTYTSVWYKGGSMDAFSRNVVGEWNHYVFTIDYEKGESNYYINGKKHGTTRTNVDTTHYLRGDFSFGQNGLDLSENDIRIYDHALSPREVKEISKGLVLHYPLSMPGGDNLAKNTSTIADPSSNGSGYRIYQLSSTIPSGTTVTISCRIDADNITLSGNKRLGLSTAMSKTDGTGNYYFEAWKNYSNGLSDGASFHGYISNTKVIPGDMKAIGAYLQTVSSGTVTISEVKVEIGDKRTPWLPNPADPEYSVLGFNDGIEYDVSGYGNNGTKVGNITYDSDTPRYETSAVFNGSNAYIETDSLPLETKTISVWIKTTWASASGYKIVFHDKNTRLAIGFSDTRIITYVGSDGSDIGTQFQTSGIYIANQWNHLVLVKTGDKTRVLYLNGVEVSPYGNNYWGGDLDKLNIGIRHYNGGYSSIFNGQISDFRAYTTALSAEDVYNLYAVGASISDTGVLFSNEVSEL